MNGDSQLFGISIRAWLSIVLTVSVCVMSVLGIKVEEPLYSGFLLGLGFYFGQKVATKQTTEKPGGNA